MDKPTLVMHERPSAYSPLVSRGNKVVVSLTGNMTFVTPAVALTVIQTSVTDVVSAQALWGDIHNRGTHANLVDLKNKALILYNNLRAELAYCETTALTAAQTDNAMMKSLLSTCGFDIKGDNSPVGVLEAVQNFHQVISRELNKNQIEFAWDVPANASSGDNVNVYDLFIGDTNDFTLAIHLASTKPTKYIYTNATTAVQNKFFWVLAHGAAGDGVVSAVLSISILGA